PALRRTGAARGDRARHRHRSEHPRVRRAHRRSRSQERRGDPDAAHEAEHRLQEDHPDGDPRSGGRPARLDHAPPQQGEARMIRLYARIAWKNMRRSWFRTVFTVAGAAVALIAFIMLRTTLWAWNM